MPSTLTPPESAADALQGGTLIDRLLAEKGDLTTVARFARKHAEGTQPSQARYYRDLIPLTRPGEGEQYAFEVDLDRCSSCKACVAACHSLNGLEEGEMWRSVGLLHSAVSERPAQQAVTTACHHCAEPGCLEGCPVAAYEKDAATGIVRHLDDQCIGCQYCSMKCPYDVPKYSERLGIVRKCDMCHTRLAADEAPACVQSCPGEAIAIRVVPRAVIEDRAANGIFLPDTPDPVYTKPSTSYVSTRHLPRSLKAADHGAPLPQPAHWPLVLMLVLTQIGAGMLGTGAVFGGQGLLNVRQEAWMAAVGMLVFAVGLGASVLHLGRPLKAWRFFLGLRTSWLSREILAFQIFAAVATAFVTLRVDAVFAFLPAAFPAVPRGLVDAALVLTGALAVFCSGMVYHDTRRPLWRWQLTMPRFFGTAVMFGLSVMLLVLALDQEARVAVTPIALGVAGLRFVKMCAELSLLAHLKEPHTSPLRRTAQMLVGVLRGPTRLRFVAGITGGIVLPLVIVAGAPAAPLACVSLALCIVSEVVERWLFFRSVSPDRMPGGVAA